MHSITKFGILGVGVAALAGMAVTVSAQDAGTPPAQAPSARAFSPAELRDDLALLRTAFQEVHSGAYRYRSKAQVDVAFDAAAGKLARPMTAIEFFRILAPLVATIQDGHTRVQLPKADMDAFAQAAPLLPLRVHLAGGKLYALRDLRANAARAGIEGSEIQSINGMAVKRFLPAMVAALEGDGSIPSSRIAKLRTFRFNALFGMLFGTSGQYRVGLKGAGKPILLAGVPLAALNKTWSERFPEGPPAELVFHGDNVAVLTVRSFGGHADRDRKVKLDAFLADAFKQIDARHARSLVIDVRNNGGGEDALGRILLSYLVDAPFTYYNGLYINRRDISFARHVDRWPGRIPDEMAGTDAQGRLHLVSHPNLGEHKPATPGFAGRAVVLMNGASFSTTAEFLSVLHHRHRAIFVGEEAGGGYYGNTSGAVLELTLPGSGMRINVPVVRYELAVNGFAPADRGVPADHRVEPSAADLLAGRDPAMQRALVLAGNP